jgi:glutathione synthase/RimK-type ligase-like ATP-grasp enzyme
MILVLSHRADDHAVGVLAALERRGYAAALIDTSRFPMSMDMRQRYSGSAQVYEIVIDGCPIDLTTCRAAWWRRPQAFVLDPRLSPQATSFSYSECHEAVAGLWAALDIAWVNPPVLDEVAHHKPYQLATAARVGLSIPETLITNDPEAARDFVAHLGVGRTVYKTFLATEECWRETRILQPQELAELDGVRLAPVIFQEYVPALADIRATVVGDRIFAAAIRAAPSGYAIDYRMDIDGASFEATSLPAHVEGELHAFMKELGLVYGAIDLRRCDDDRYVLLEVNPAGEWRFVEERTGQPITEAMADLLMNLDRE